MEDVAVSAGVLAVVIVKPAVTSVAVDGFLSRISGSGWKPLASKGPVRVSRRWPGDTRTELQCPSEPGITWSTASAGLQVISTTVVVG